MPQHNRADARASRLARPIAAWPLSIGLLVAAACGAPAQPASAVAAPPRPVRVAPAAELRRAVGAEITGTIRAVRSATLTPRVSGTVVAVHAALGSRVRAGEVLVRLQARELDARLDQARAIHAHARLERDRTASLRELDAVASAHLDDAQAQLHIAEASLAEAQTMLEQTTVRAPFAGTVTSKLVEVGDTAIPGRPLLVVEDPDVLRFEAMVPEAAARTVAIGQTRRVSIGSQGPGIDGTIAEISPSADPASRTVLVKLDLPRHADARPGTFGRVALASGEQSIVTVPQDARVRRGQLDEVFVVDGGRARLRLVRTGAEHDGVVEILAGVRAGEPIAVAGADQLVDGQAIEARP